MQKFRKNRDLSFHDIVDSNNNDVSKLNNANSSISSDHLYVTTYAFDAPLSGPAPSPTQTACKTDKVTSRRPPLTNLNGPTPRVIQESSSASCATTDGSTKTNNKSHVPLSPRKRSREGSPADTARVSRHRNSADEDDNRERSTSSKVHAKSKNFPIPDNGTLISFLGHKLPVTVIAKIMEKLPPDDFVNVTFHVLLPSYQSTLKEMQTQIRHERSKLENLKNVPPQGPLTQPQKVMLRSLITNRENNTDENDCIIIPNVGSGGKAKYFLKVPKIQTQSSNAVKRTKNRRSQLIEKVEKIVSTPSTGTSNEENSDLHHQRVNNITRDMVGYAAAAEEAGLKIVTKFKNDTVLSLRSVMTLRMWRVLKRVFSSEVGWDVFGSVDDMKKELKQMEFQYECGTFTPSTGDTVHFVRVQDVREVIVQLVSLLTSCGKLAKCNIWTTYLKTAFGFMLLPTRGGRVRN